MTQGHEETVSGSRRERKDVATSCSTLPGTYTLVDHAIFRLDKGAVGFLNVAGEPRPDVYGSAEPPAPCVGCKLHA